MKPTIKARTKRQLDGRRRFHIGDIPTNKLSNLNIDIPWKRCYVRALTYAVTEKGEQPVIRAVVTLIGRKNTDQERYYGFTSDVTNAGGVERRGAAWCGVVRRGAAWCGVVRIPAWCDSDPSLQSKISSWDLKSGSELLVKLIPDQLTLEKLSSALKASIVEAGMYQARLSSPQR